MKKKIRLGTLSILMLISFILLTAFISRWLYLQYGEEKKTLMKVLSSHYESIKQRHYNKLINKFFLSNIDSSKHYNTGSQISIVTMTASPMSKNKIFAKKIDTPKLYLSNKSKKTGSMKATSSFEMYINKSVNISKNDTLSTLANKQISDEAIAALIDTNMLQGFIQSIIHKAGDSSFQFSIVPDSIHKDMEVLMSSDYRDIKRYYAATSGTDVTTIYADTNHSGLYFGISQFRWHLIKTIMPQILFCLLLLFLCSVAFILSYRTVKQQLRLAEQKNDFISNMSHELKTPVTTAKLALEAFNHFDVLADSRKTKDYLQIVSWEMNRLEMLVANVLNNALLEEGRIQFRKQTVNLNQLLQQLVVQFTPVCMEQNKVLILEPPVNEVQICADVLHIQGALYNIIDNALKYGKQKVIVSTSQSDSSVEISIADDGNGIPTEYKEKIFDKFFRVPNGNEHLVKGSGLGLHYAKYVVMSHQGTINFHHSSSGSCVFLVSLPKLSDV